MAKRVFIVHRWEGKPESDWYPWLKDELVNKGFQVEVPAMPNSDEPQIEEWVPFLEEKVGDVDQDTYFIGHSVGCQTIMRFLQNLPPGSKIGGAIFVAGWIHLTSEVTDDEEEYQVAKPWLDRPIIWEDVSNKTDKFIALFSDTDPYVPIGDAKLFEEKLGAKIIFESRKGHFTEVENVRDLKIVLNELLDMSN